MFYLHNQYQNIILLRSVNTPYFNVPKKHAEAICEEIIARGMDITWSTGALKPIGITDCLSRLFKESGCSSVVLEIETASEKMLKKMKRGYKVDNIKEALTCLSRSDIPFRVSLMLGALVETPDTIAETFRLIERFEKLQSSWVSIGISLWTHYQDLLDDARKAGQLKNDEELFNVANYVSPELPKSYMIELIDSLRNDERYIVQVNKPYAEYSDENCTIV
jgi:radical SAM superfamily enzyme YgiQ (UPF0313 family)